MGNYIADNRSALQQRHYIRKAGTQEYWFDFSSNRLNSYKSQFGLSFCMVLYGSDTEDDAYVMPYAEVTTLFTEDILDHRARWIGNIRNNILRINGGRSLSVSAYYNAFDLLDLTEVQGTPSINEDNVLDNLNGDVDRQSLQRKVQLFNERYQNVTPHKRRVVSEQVARPGIITDYLKQLHNYTCQLCSEQGFLQRNGTRYIEAHHILELHRLIPGSYCSDNVIIVCPTCHRKLHYASITYAVHQGDQVVACINGNTHQFTRNIMSNY